jgi:HEAT repeat protein
MEAHIALWRIEGKASETLPRLINDLSLVDVHCKWEIFKALAEMGYAARDAVPAIIPSLHSTNPEVRQRAAEALWEIDPGQAIAPTIVEALIEPMNNPNATTGNLFSVTEGAKLLGRMGVAARSAILSLVKLTKHSNPPTRTAAAEALKRIDPVLSAEK